MYALNPLIPVRPAAPRSDGVFDVPPCIESRRNDVSTRVAAVSKEWSWGMADEKSLALIIPSTQDPLAVSKQKFVALLEYSEEELGLEKVLALFEKSSNTIEHGFPRTLRYIGFRVLAPDATPETIDTSKYFAMSYTI
ncbi:unnamed protein product [Auanema sp. JU1783]|nr:unnamed protein product [Auanema sp. JU1783]